MFFFTQGLLFCFEMLPEAEGEVVPDPEGDEVGLANMAHVETFLQQLYTNVHDPGGYCNKECPIVLQVCVQFHRSLLLCSVLQHLKAILRVIQVKAEPRKSVAYASQMDWILSILQ